MEAEAGASFLLLTNTDVVVPPTSPGITLNLGELRAANTIFPISRSYALGGKSGNGQRKPTRFAVGTNAAMTI
jgi:hypothetical protein